MAFDNTTYRFAHLPESEHIVMNQHSREVKWTEELCYLGNMEYVMYRTAGDTVQVRVELPINLNEVVAERGIKKYHGSTEEARDFILTYRDNEIVLHPGYLAGPNGAAYVPPSLFIIGWKDLTSPQELAQYESDKQNMVKRPT